MCTASRRVFSTGMNEYVPAVENPTRRTVMNAVCIASGIAIAVLGFAYDARWHAAGGTHHDVLIPIGHVAYLIGIAAILVGSMGEYRRSQGRSRTALAVVLAGIGGGSIGILEDELLHAAGIHHSFGNEVDHLVGRIGLLAFVVAIVAAAWIGRRESRDRDGVSDRR